MAASVRVGLGYAERMLKDVTPDQFARFAQPGGETIESNHPAFIYGHLSLYAARIIEGVGGDASSYQPSPAFENAFSKDAKCVDDPDGSIYPTMKEVTETLFTNYRAVAESLDKADDSVFTQPNPGPMQDRFPTIGAMYMFYIGGHFMLHIGQLSAWRRAMGLGPA